MTFARVWVIIIVLQLTCLVQLPCTAWASEPTTDSARTALKSHSFPWYDADKDAFRPLHPTKEPAPTKSRDWPNLPVQSPGIGLPSIQLVVMWVLLVIGLILLIMVVIRTGQFNVVLPESGKTPIAATVSLEMLAALPEPARGVRDLLGEAERLAGQSAYGAAMTFYYSWQLLQLDQQQVIEVQKGKTNRQYLREVRAARQELVSLFEPSMRLFEDAFFGNLPVAGEQFHQVWEKRHRFSSTLRRPRS